MKLSNFDYNLQKELIAQEGLEKRDSSKLMIVEKTFEHRHFYDIIDYLKDGDVLVINDTKVAKAKLEGKKSTGAKAIILVERKKGDAYDCRVETNKPKIGNVFLFQNGLTGEIVGQNEDLFVMKFSSDLDEFLAKYGELPQPGYIKRKVSDREYQTVYAKKEGSLAAPTAGLHFTDELLKKIESKGIKIARVCLHVGLGTFTPIRSEEIDEHKMHEEFFAVSKEACDIINSCKARLICVGTTSLRCIESCKYNGEKIIPSSGFTGIFITPGYRFKSRTEMLITNFHLPKSTLLVLVSAFAGREKIMSAYQEAIKKNYRFYSLGDAMLLFKENSQPQ